MTDKELVERLNAYSAQYQNHGGITAEAADRIEQLRAELTNERIDNTNLIGELATVAAERDRYKAVHENPQPLTLEELLRMDGEVVYIPESEEYFGGMGIVSVSRKMVVDVKGLEYGVWPLGRYGAGWLAYRRKPEEER